MESSRDSQPYVRKPHDFEGELIPYVPLCPVSFSSSYSLTTLLLPTLVLLGSHVEFITFIFTFWNFYHLLSLFTLYVLCTCRILPFFLTFFSYGLSLVASSSRCCFLHASLSPRREEAGRTTDSTSLQSVRLPVREFQFPVLRCSTPSKSLNNSTHCKPETQKHD